MTPPSRSKLISIVFLTVFFLFCRYVSVLILCVSLYCASLYAIYLFFVTQIYIYTRSCDWGSALYFCIIFSISLSLAWRAENVTRLLFCCAVFDSKYDRFSQWLSFRFCRYLFLDLFIAIVSQELFELQPPNKRKTTEMKHWTRSKLSRTFLLALSSSAHALAHAGSTLADFNENIGKMRRWWQWRRWRLRCVDNRSVFSTTTRNETCLLPIET